MQGLSLLKVLIEATGLPPEAVERELSQMLAQRGLDPANVSLEDVREILAAYLQNVLVDAKEELR